MLFCVCGVLGLPAPVHRCARSVCCVACAVSWASGFCSPVCLLGVLCCVCGVLGLPAPVHRCARSVCCVACAVSWASRLLFTGVPARCVVLRVRCPGPPGSCSPVCPLALLCCVCGVLGPPAPVYRCVCSVCCFACAVSWASRLLFTGVPARCVVLRVRCPAPPGSCSPVCPLGVLCCVCGVLGLRLLFNGVVSTAVAALQQRPHRPHNHSRQRPHRPHNHSRAAECSLDPFSHPHIPTFFRTFFLSSSHVSVCQLQAPLSLVHTSVWVRQRKWSIQEVWNFSSNFNQQFI